MFKQILNNLRLSVKIALLGGGQCPDYCHCPFVAGGLAK